MAEQIAIGLYVAALCGSVALAFNRNVDYDAFEAMVARWCGRILVCSICFMAGFDTAKKARDASFYQDLALYVMGGALVFYVVCFTTRLIAPSIRRDKND